MTLQEIVCAIVDHGTITSDPKRIEAAKTFGQHVQYITRRQANQFASLYPSPEWLQLAVAATLFLTDGMSVFRPQPGI